MTSFTKMIPDFAKTAGLKIVGGVSAFYVGKLIKKAPIAPVKIAGYVLMLASVILIIWAFYGIADEFGLAGFESMCGNNKCTGCDYYGESEGLSCDATSSKV